MSSRDDIERSLLRQVVAEPHDLAPRLVCADWYDEQGDPRGEFIRLQVALRDDRLADHDRRRLTARGDLLLADHRREWDRIPRGILRDGRPVPPPDGGRRSLHGWAYGGGFIEELWTTPGYFALNAELLLQLGPIQRLRLFQVDAAGVRQLAACESLARIRGLSFGSGQVTAGTLLTISESPHAASLRNLDLRGSDIDAAVAHALFPRIAHIECDPTVATIAPPIAAPPAPAWVPPPVPATTGHRPRHNRFSADAAWTVFLIPTFVVLTGLLLQGPRWLGTPPGARIPRVLQSGVDTRQIGAAPLDLRSRLPPLRRPAPDTAPDADPSDSARTGSDSASPTTRRPPSP